MSKHLQRDLKDLEQNLLDQSSVVEQMVYHVCEALRDLNTDGLRDVMIDEEQVNHREVLIEEECLKILALHQPVAVDLRRVATVMKINADLERDQQQLLEADLVHPRNAEARRALADSYAEAFDRHC